MIRDQELTMVLFLKRSIVALLIYFSPCHISCIDIISTNVKNFMHNTEPLITRQQHEILQNAIRTENDNSSANTCRYICE